MRKLIWLGLGLVVVACGRSEGAGVDGAADPWRGPPQEQTLTLPPATEGPAVSYSCFDDADCPPDIPRCTVVTEEGVRACQPLGEGMCNQQADCWSNKRCALPDVGVVGFCGDGHDQSVCYDDYDCRESAHCVSGRADLTWGLSRCSTGLSQTSCFEDGDCKAGRCLAYKCSSGGPSELCESDADCQAGMPCVTVGQHGLGSCSAGARWSSCDDVSQCQAGLHCAFNLCVDGGNDSFCEVDDHCDSGGCAGGTCTSGEPNSLCMDDQDCLSGSCRDEVVSDSLPGLCD